MAVEIQTVVLCDRHLADKDEREPGESWEFTVKGPGMKTQTLVVDACQDCAAVLIEAAGYLDAYGRKPGKAAKAPKRTEPEPEALAPEAPELLTCPECGRDNFRGAQGLGSHRFRSHGVKGATRVQAGAE